MEEQEQNRKSVKSRRETSVQGTNDSSIVSKCSTAACGYFNDPFLHHFVSKQNRRAPLIHRGYYIRAVAFDQVFKKFLADNAGNKTQILSLGCGFDSTYFRLKDDNLLEQTTFYEIDFPDLVKRKHKIMECKQVLMDMLTKKNEPSSSPHIELSCEGYYLLGVDLTQLNTLEAALKMCAIDFEVPTLLFSECVMTYMTRRCSTEVVKWAAETFETATFSMYEQVNPDDAFGLFMQRHFNSIGSPLKCINAFPTVQTQKKRFLDNGWTNCQVVDMNTFYYHCLQEEERSRVECLEAFDEYEELNLKYSHYFILVANKSCKGLVVDYLSPKVNLQDENMQQPSAIVDIERVSHTVNSVRRFGHTSSLVPGGFVVTTGGFGEVDGRHQRLTDITVTDTKSLESHHVHCISSDIQYARMHHACVTLGNGSTYLIAGRQSPYFMCDQMLKINFHGKDRENATVSNSNHIPNQLDKNSVKTVDSSNVSEEKTQKMSVCDNLRNIQICDSQTSGNIKDNACEDSLEDSGGFQDNSCKAKECMNEINMPSLKQSYLCPFGVLDIEVVNQCGDVLPNRWRHAACLVAIDGVEKIFVHGGKTKTGEIMEDAYLFDPALQHWTKMCYSGPKPEPRHSHHALFWKGHVVLTGGLDHNQVPVGDIHLLSLETGVWDKLDIDNGHLTARYSHSAQMVEDKLVMIGGIHLYHRPPGVLVVDLIDKTLQQYDLPTPDKSHLLMLHRIMSVKLSPEKILVLGGGGNCFSFGTHLNITPLILNIK